MANERKIHATREELMAPRTIDKLGIDVSTRYAEDKQKLDEALIKESQSIPAQAQIDVTSPAASSEVEALLKVQPTVISWASFPPPARYFEQRKKLFTFQMIPSMGTEDRQESQAQKILSRLQTMPKEAAHPDKKDPREQYLEERSREEGEKEKKVLTTLLQTIALYDKQIIEINSRRSQYQKG